MVCRCEVCSPCVLRCPFLAGAVPARAQITNLEVDIANLKDHNQSLMDTNARLLQESRKDKMKLLDVEALRGRAEGEWKAHRTSLVSTTARNMVRLDGGWR
jgi:hypothetical protein